MFLLSLSRDYSVEFRERYGELVLEIRRYKKERIWINVVLFIATFISTTLMGAMISENTTVDGFKNNRFQVNLWIEGLRLS